MKDRRLAAATCTAVAALAAAALHTPSLPRAGAQASAPTDMVHLQSLYSEKCSACHNLPDAKEKGYTRREWRQTVNQMLTKYKASDSISPTEAGEIVDYLATFAVPDNAANRGPRDPWATDAVDVWTEIPTASRVFDFETPGMAPDLAPVAAGTAGPAANWHVVSSAAADGSYLKEAPVRPTASRFGLLLDRANPARNLDIRVRFKIVSGAVSPAVGIVFGFTDPKAYNVLRYDAHHDTLSLMTMNEPTHTTLQQTSLSAPDPAAATPALATNVAPVVTAAPKPTGSDGWHTLRLLVRDGQIRGWLDMNKRISIADNNDTTGKVGLWTQGDTVAAFSDWTIDIYDASPTAPTTPAPTMQ